MATVNDLRERLESAWRTGELLELPHTCREDQAPDEDADLTEVPGDLIREVLTLPDGHRRGLRLHGALIADGLDLAWADLPRPLALACCIVDGDLDLSDVTVPTLHVDRARLRSVDISDARITHNLFITESHAAVLNVFRSQVTGNMHLTRLTATDTVDLAGLKVGGQLAMEGATLSAGLENTALNAHSIDVTGGVFLSNGLTATGTVNLSGAKIGGGLVLVGATLSAGPEKTALNAQNIDVVGDVFLSGGLTATGAVDLAGAKIGGGFYVSGATLSAGPENTALNAQNIDVTEGIFLNDGLTATGTVRLVGAKIGGGLALDGATLITRPELTALNAQNIDITGDMFLRDGLTATGTVDLAGAKIGGQLTMSGATLSAGPGRAALTARSAVVAEDIILSDGFAVTGTVDLSGAKVGGALSMEGATLSAELGYTALNAQNIDVTGPVYLSDGLTAIGTVDLAGARLADDLIVRRSGLSPGSPHHREEPRAALRLTSARVQGTLHLFDLHDVDETHRHLPGSVDLSGAHVGELWDDTSAWPQEWALWLDGFVYDRLHARAPRDPIMRLAWIRSAAEFTPQPYRQLAGALEVAGLGDEAIAVRKALVHDIAKSAGSWARVRVWFGHVIGHGYNPWRPLWGLVFLLIATGVVLQAGLGSLVPTADQAPRAKAAAAASNPVLVRADQCIAERVDSYPCPSVLAYAIETVVPLVDLHQAAYWQPANRTTGERRLAAWLRFAALGGWICSTFLAAGLAGAVKNRV